MSIHYPIEEKYIEALKTLNALLKINPRLYDACQNVVRVKEYAETHFYKILL